MSAKAGSAGAAILGAVEIVVGVLLLEVPGVGPAGIAAGIATIIGGVVGVAAGIVGLTMGSQIQNPTAANASQIKFGTTQEGLPVPVIFGEVKVVPQFMNWSAKNFRSASIPAGGKGGGSSQISGYNYFLSFELGLCMGPIDEVGQILSVPGDVMMRGNTWIQTNLNIQNQQIFASQAGTTAVVASADVFSSGMVGAEIVYEDGNIAIITAFTDSKHVTVDTAYTITANSFQIYALPEQIVFGGSDSEDIQIQGGFLQGNSQSFTEGGMIRIYKGSSTQTRASAGDPYFQTFTSGVGFNYRNMAWVLFMDFQIGQNSPVPKTYQFICRRLPKCIRDDGSMVTAIVTNGSNDTTSPSYYQANPAAMIYEILTNTVWGRGVSSALIDEASFATASNYYAANNLGLSMQFDSVSKMSQFLENIKQHIKSILSWKNGVWTLRCLLDPNQIASTILTLNADEVEELQVSRPLWPATINDIRVEFNSRARLYKPDVAHIQDLANIQLTGRVNPARVSLNGFTEFDQAMRQGYRILSDSSYPLATANFLINRFHSQLEIGDLFRLIWNEWGATTVTTYMEVQKIEPQAIDDERLKITCIESSMICPIAATELSVALPTTFPWQEVVEIDESDLYFFGGGTTFGLINPIIAFEMPAIWTGGSSEQVLIVGQRPSSNVPGMQVFYAQGNQNFNTLDESGTPEAKGVPGTPPKIGGGVFGFSGQLTTQTTTQTNFDRLQEFFQFTINNPSDKATFLGINSVVADTDSLETLANNAADFFLIGEEIIAVGCVEQISTSPDIYHCRNIIRGVFGTPIQQHNPADLFFYLPKLSAGFNTTNFSTGVTTAFKANPLHVGGSEAVGNDFFINHDGADNQLYLGIGELPLAPERNSIVLVGSGSSATYSILVRPKFFNSGGGTNPLFGEFDSTDNISTGIVSGLKQVADTLTFQIHYYDALGNILSRFVTGHVFKPETYTDLSSGLVSITNVPSQINGTAVRKIEVYALIGKNLSRTPATYCV